MPEIEHPIGACLAQQLVAAIAAATNVGWVTEWLDVENVLTVATRHRFILMRAFWVRRN
jgi:hypothetical protein